MKKIGEVLHQSTSGRSLLVCRITGYLEAERKIFNEKLEEIGRIKETFGPADHPFAKVKIESQYKNYKGAIFVIEK